MGAREGLDRSLRESTAQIIEAALALEHDDRSRAARRLGVGVRTIQRHLGRAFRERER